MKQTKILQCILPLIFGFAILLFGAAALSGAEETKTAAADAVNSAPAKGEATNIVGTNLSEIDKIKQQQQATENAIKKATDEIGVKEKKAEEIVQEKEDIKYTAMAKKEEAAVVKAELEITKKEVEVTGDNSAKKKAKELAKESEKLEKEAAIHEAKLASAEQKAQIVQENIAVSKARVESLKDALMALTREKAAKRGFIDKVITSFTIIVMGLVLYFLKKYGIRKFERMLTKKDVIREDEATLRAKTLTHLFNWLANIVIIGVVVYMVLDNHGLNLAPLLAGAGIMGIAFGFGGQYLIRDLINGLFILVEGQYRIGDVVKIGEYGGLVEDIDLRITTLRDLEGRVVIIPNGEIKTVVNYTREYSHALLDVGVAYKENVDKVMAVIKEVGTGMREDKHFGRLILDELEMLGVDAFADSAVIIRFRIKTLPIKQWDVMREFRRRLKNRFDELGIEIPFPHRTLYWGTGEENKWVRALAEKSAK